MVPRFLGRKCEDRGDKPAKRVESLMHYSLCRTSASRVRGIAIHPVLSDVDVKAAQIDRAKLVQAVIDFVEFERLISRSAILHHLIEPFEDPAVNQSKLHLPAFLPS